MHYSITLFKEDHSVFIDRVAPVCFLGRWYELQVGMTPGSYYTSKSGQATYSYISKKAVEITYFLNKVKIINLLEVIDKEYYSLAVEKIRKIGSTAIIQ